MYRLFLIISILLSVQQIVASSDSAPSLSTKFFSEPLLATFFLELPSQELSVNSKAQESRSFSYKPNAPVFGGFGLSAERWSAKIFLPLPKSREEIDGKGQTYCFSTVVSRYWSDSGIDLVISDFRGFYKSIEGTTQSNYEKRADLRIRNIVLNYYYVFRPQSYSFQAVQNHDHENAHTGGSWLLMASIDNTYLESDHTLVMGQDSSIYGRAGQMTGLGLNSAGVGGGYGYAWHTGHFLLSGNFLVELGPQFQRLNFVDETQNSTNRAWKSAANIGVSYKFMTWVAGLDAKFNQVDSDLGSIDLQTSVTAASIFAETFF